MKKIRLIAGIIISIFFLYLVFRKVNFHEIVEIVRSANKLYLILALSLSVFVLYVRSRRWKHFLGDNCKNVKLHNLFSSLCIGQMVNNVLPFRIGDLTQAYFLGHKENLSKSTVFSTIIMKRLFDLVPPVIILITGSFFVLLPNQFGLTKIAIPFVILISIIFLIVKLNRNLQKFLDYVFPKSKFKEKLINLINDFYLGLKIIKKKDSILRIFLYTLVVWSTYMLTVWSCLRAFGIELNIIQCALVMSIIAMSVVIPASPGYVGTWEAFAVIALKIFAVEKTRALAFALVYHFVCWLPITVLGLYFFIRSGISLAQIQQE